MKLCRLWAALLLQAAHCYSLRQIRQKTTPRPAALTDDLERLALAVEHGDVPAVERITESLRKEALRRSRFHDVNSHQNKHASREGNASKGENISASSFALTGQSTSCVFDDQIFRLDDKAKAELTFELKQPAMAEAMAWVRYGGWWTCAVYGEVCNCEGNVRMIDWDRTSSSASVVNALVLPERQVRCELVAFGGVDPKPGATKVCECAVAQPYDDVDTFSLQKRLTSASYLQEAWIFLLRLMARTTLLPMGTGDRLYHGIEHWAARAVPGSMPLVLERVWIEMFVKQIVLPSTTAFHKCLEWGNPATPGKGFNYLNMMPQCTDKWDMQFDGVFHGQKQMGIEGNVVYSDIDHLPIVLTQGVDNRMDLIFATQVFEHIYNPKEAAKLLLASLRPGGAVVFTAPQQAQFHRVPHDYFRYSKEGALQILQEAGFCIPSWAFAGGGDFIFDIARDAGLLVKDFPNEEISGAFQIGYENISDSAITIHALAFRPPHSVCPSSMPPLSR